MDFSKEYIEEVQAWVQSLIPVDSYRYVEYDFKPKDFAFLTDIFYILADYKKSAERIDSLRDQLEYSFEEIELLNDEIDNMYEELCSTREENN